MRVDTQPNSDRVATTHLDAFMICSKKSFLTHLSQLKNRTVYVSDGIIVGTIRKLNNENKTQKPIRSMEPLSKEESENFLRRIDDLVTISPVEEADEVYKRFFMDPIFTVFGRGSAGSPIWTNIIDQAEMGRIMKNLEDQMGRTQSLVEEVLKNVRTPPSTFSETPELSTEQSVAENNEQDSSRIEQMNTGSSPTSKSTDLSQTNPPSSCDTISAPLITSPVAIPTVPPNPSHQSAVSASPLALQVPHPTAATSQATARSHTPTPMRTNYAFHFPSDRSLGSFHVDRVAENNRRTKRNVKSMLTEIWNRFETINEEGGWEPPAKKSKSSEFCEFAIIFHQRARVPTIHSCDILREMTAIGLNGIPESAITPICDHVKSMRTIEPTWMIEFAVSEEYAPKVEEFAKLNQFVSWDLVNKRPSKPILCNILDTDELLHASMMSLVTGELLEHYPGFTILIGRDKIKIETSGRESLVKFDKMVIMSREEVDKAVKKFVSRYRKKWIKMIEEIEKNQTLF